MHDNEDDDDYFKSLEMSSQKIIPHFMDLSKLMMSEKHHSFKSDNKMSEDSKLSINDTNMQPTSNPSLKISKMNQFKNKLIVKSK